MVELKKYKLTAEQEKLWFEWKKSPKSHAYNIAILFKLDGDLDYDRFKNAIDSSVEYFENLRTSFLEEENIPYHIVNNNDVPKLKFIDLTTSGSLDGDLGERAIGLLADIHHRPFCLTDSNLLRLYLIKAGEGEHYFGFYMPHILADTISSEKLLSFIAAKYNSNDEILVRFKECKETISDYHNSQLGRMDEELGTEAIDFWSNYLDGHDLNLVLPNRSGQGDVKGERLHFSLTKDEYQAVRNLARRNRTTIFTVLTGLFNILFYRYYGAKDIVTGYPISVRPKQLKSYYGFFVNNTALRCKLDGDMTFNQLIESINISRKYCRGYINYPFNKVFSDLRKAGKKLSDNPLNISVGQTNFFRQSLKLNGLEVESLPVDFAEVNNDITLLYDTGYFGDDFKMAIEYRFAAFEPYFIKNMIGHIKQLIKSIGKNPDESIDSYNLLGGKEKRELGLENVNLSADKKDDHIINLFEKTVKDNPDLLAIICQGERVTYADLNKRANKIAANLQLHNVKRGDFVAVYLDRSINMVATLLGILKVGAAYVPLNASYPEEKIADILVDSKAKMIVTEQNQLGKITDLVEFLDIDHLTDITSYHEPQRAGTDSAYVIYTSGSTGRAKGVEAMHKNVCARLLWFKDKVNLNQSNKILAHFNIGFDASVMDIFAPLISASVVILADSDQAKDPRQIRDLINKHRIRNIIMVPSLLGSLLKCLDIYDCLFLEKVLVGAEVLTPKLRDKFYSHFKHEDTKLCNIFGPTESTIFTSYFEVPKDGYEKNIPVGKALDGSKLYVLNNKLQGQPYGTIGEIYVGGSGIAKGYLNNEDLTNEKFVVDIFSNIKGDKLYKTGDLGRVLPDGNIEFIGRVDSQVKIRGYRVELGEIETKILNLDWVDQVKLIFDNNQRLIAYYVLSDGVKNLDIRSQLVSKLPDYMIPHHFICLQELPLNSNDKIDMARLPEPAIEPKIDANFVPARNDLDKRLQKIWSFLLKIKPEKISIYDKFFDIGGDSLMTIDLSLNIEKEFGQTLSVSKIFELPNIASCSDYLSLQMLKTNISSDNDNRSEQRLLSIRRQRAKNKKRA